MLYHQNSIACLEFDSYTCVVVLLPFQPNEQSNTMARDANGFESPLSHGYSRMGSHFYAHADHVIASNHHEGSPSRLQRSTTLLEVRTLLQEHALHTFDYEKLKTSASELKKKKKPIREYYEHLNEQLDYYKEIE